MKQKHLFHLRVQGKFIDKIAAVSSTNAYRYFKAIYPDLPIPKKQYSILDVGVAKGGFATPSVEYDFPQYCVKNFRVNGAVQKDIKKAIIKSLKSLSAMENMSESQLEKYNQRGRLNEASKKNMLDKKKRIEKYKFD